MEGVCTSTNEVVSSVQILLLIPFLKYVLPKCLNGQRNFSAVEFIILGNNNILPKQISTNQLDFKSFFIVQ